MADRLRGTVRTGRLVARYADGGGQLVEPGHGQLIRCSGRRSWSSASGPALRTIAGPVGGRDWETSGEQEQHLYFGRIKGPAGPKDRRMVDARALSDRRLSADGQAHLSMKLEEIAGGLSLEGVEPTGVVTVVAAVAI